MRVNKRFEKSKRWMTHDCYFQNIRALTEDCYWIVAIKIDELKGSEKMVILFKSTRYADIESVRRFLDRLTTTEARGLIEGALK